MKMGIVLSDLQIKAIFGHIGREESEFLVCAVCPSDEPGAKNLRINCVKSCTDRDDIQKLKKELKKEFPKTDPKVLKTKVRRIE
jgi:hypothetical protein